MKLESKMSQFDDSSFPIIRVHAPVPSEEVAVPVPVGVIAPKANRLAELWFEAYEAKRAADAAMKRLRAEIEPILDRGEPVESSMGFLSWAESRVLKADSAGLFEEIGARLFVKVSEVPTPRIRELIEAKILESTAPCLRYQTLRRLVTRYR
ncbi:MAG: hypothetical protein JSS66_10145 [Armatimonadetes bacterium]|nr:hypothetical protein [Armatimonadota bacterium]